MPEPASEADAAEAISFATALTRLQMGGGGTSGGGIRSRRRLLAAGSLPFLSTAAALRRQQRSRTSMTAMLSPSPSLPRHANLLRVEPRVVHRLDQATSGLQVLALTSPVQRSLSVAFEARALSKVYEAVLDTRAAEAAAASGGAPWVALSPLLLADAGEISTPLNAKIDDPLVLVPQGDDGDVGGKVAPALDQAAIDTLLYDELTVLQKNGDLDFSSEDRERTATSLAVVLAPLLRGAVAPAAGAKPSLTQWRVLERLPGAVRVELRPHTGRTHQLRLHAALPPPLGLGAPVLGDGFYGDAALPAQPPFGPELLCRAVRARQSTGMGAAAASTGDVLLLASAVRRRAAKGENASVVSATADAWVSRWPSLLSRRSSSCNSLSASRLFLHARELHVPDHFLYSRAAEAAALTGRDGGTVAGTCLPPRRSPRAAAPACESVPQQQSRRVKSSESAGCANSEANSSCEDPIDDTAAAADAAAAAAASWPVVDCSAPTSFRQAPPLVRAMAAVEGSRPSSSSSLIAAAAVASDSKGFAPRPHLAALLGAAQNAAGLPTGVAWDADGISAAVYVYEGVVSGEGPRARPPMPRSVIAFSLPPPF